MVNKVIEELMKEKEIYVKSKIKRDYKNIIFYLIFIFFVTSIWFINKQFQTFPIWLSNIIGLILFLIPLVVMRLINHSIFNTLFFKKRRKKIREGI